MTGDSEVSDARSQFRTGDLPVVILDAFIKGKPTVKSDLHIPGSHRVCRCNATKQIG